MPLYLLQGLLEKEKRLRRNLSILMVGIFRYKKLPLLEAALPLINKKTAAEIVIEKRTAKKIGTRITIV